MQTLGHQDQRVALEGGLRRSFALQLRVAGRSPRTSQTYLLAVDQLASFAAARGMPALPDLTAEHIREFIADHLDRNRPATAASRFRSLQQFYRFLADEGEISESPFRRLRPPKVPEEIQPHFTADHVKALLKTCDERRVIGARDKAIILLLYDTGVRASELLGGMVDDVDWDAGVLLVHGKGGRDRIVSLGATVLRALDRYLRLRESRTGYLWVQRDGQRLRYNGLRMMIGRRGGKAGVDVTSIHAFRRSAAMEFLRNGGFPDDLRTLMGWRSAQMLARYTRASESARAVQAHKRHSPADHLR